MNKISFFGHVLVATQHPILLILLILLIFCFKVLYYRKLKHL